MREIAIGDIQDAANAIYDLAVRTPLVRLDLPVGLATHAGASEIYLKLETLQPIGSFKIRGARNVIRRLTAAERGDGVWTVSAGNAGLGVALAARHAGVPCSVMIVETAPRAKIDAIRSLGAAIVPASYDECWQVVESRRSPRMRGTLVHPFDDDAFMAGNGTIALEILEDLPDVETVVGALGGGGLLGGVGSVFHALEPRVDVMAAEPETAAPFAASLKNGRPSHFDGWQASFVDGAGGKSVLPTMWPLLSTVLSGSIVVSLSEVGAAMRLVAERCHVIAEGAGACAVAGALTSRAHGKTVAIVSGGNIDLAAFASILRETPAVRAS